MRTPLGDRIFDVLRQHRGAEMAISAPQIAEELALPATAERRVREAIKDESCFWSQLVCAQPGKGFFIAATVEEAHANWSWLRELAEISQETWERFDASCRDQGFNFTGLSKAMSAA